MTNSEQQTQIGAPGGGAQAFGNDVPVVTYVPGQHYNMREYTGEQRVRDCLAQFRAEQLVLVNITAPEQFHAMEMNIWSYLRFDGVVDLDLSAWANVSADGSPGWRVLCLRKDLDRWLAAATFVGCKAEAMEQAVLSGSYGDEDGDPGVYLAEGPHGVLFWLVAEREVPHG